MNSDDIVSAGLIKNVYAAEHKPFEVGDLEATVEIIGGTHYLAVGGSDETEDWVRNARIAPWWSSELSCFCHAGFLKSARKALPSLLPYMDGARRIVVAGHSKGAAEATILAALMKKAGLPVTSLITFGSPRCGFAGLKDALRGVYLTRYVNGSDPVPSVPPPLLLVLRYRHVCDETALGHPDNEGGVADHDISRYIAALGDN